MAVQSSTEKPEVRKKHTGLALASVIAVNPSVEQAKALGIPLDKETYLSTVKDKKDATLEYKRIRFDFWFKTETNPVIITKVSFFVTDKMRVSVEKGKTQFINKYGLSAWGENVENMEGMYPWFSTAGIRPAYEGEEKLVAFIRKWANTGREGECQLENVAAFFNDDIREIRETFKVLSNNKVRILLTVRDGYQAVYDSHFESQYNTSNDQFKKHLEKVYKGEYKPSDDFQKSLLFKPYEERFDVDIKDAPANLGADRPDESNNDLPF